MLLQTGPLPKLRPQLLGVSMPPHHETLPSRVLPVPGIASSRSGPPSVSIGSPPGTFICLASQKTMQAGSQTLGFCFNLFTCTHQKKEGLAYILKFVPAERERYSRKGCLLGRVPPSQCSADSVHRYPIHKSQMNGSGECRMHGQHKEEQNSVICGKADETGDQPSC